MRIAIVGDGIREIYECAMARALTQLGHTTAQFKYFGSPMDRRILHHGPHWLRRMKHYAQFPTLLRRLGEWQPDFVFCWRPDTLSADDVHKIRDLCRTPVVYYHNDNPESLKWHSSLLAAIGAYDYCFGYRPSDLDVYRNHGAERLGLLMPYSLPWAHYPPSSPQPETHAITFVGHFEHDGRQDVVAALLKAGIEVELWGRGWESATIPRLKGKFQRIDSTQYREIVWNSAVVLSFLSHRNHDVYTRRSFELPAMGACILSERTKMLSNLFPEDSSSAYFESPDECVDAASTLLNDSATRARFRSAAQNRHGEIGGDIISRMEMVVETLQSL